MHENYEILFEYGQHDPVPSEISIGKKMQDLGLDTQEYLYADVYNDDEHIVVTWKRSYSDRVPLFMVFQPEGQDSMDLHYYDFGTEGGHCDFDPKIAALFHYDRFTNPEDLEEDDYQDYQNLVADLKDRADEISALDDLWVFGPKGKEIPVYYET